MQLAVLPVTMRQAISANPACPPKITTSALELGNYSLCQYGVIANLMSINGINCALKEGINVWHGKLLMGRFRNDSD
jgi:hypothetical protein